MRIWVEIVLLAFRSRRSRPLASLTFGREDQLVDGAELDGTSEAQIDHLSQLKVES